MDIYIVDPENTLSETTQTKNWHEIADDAWACMGYDDFNRGSFIEANQKEFFLIRKSTLIIISDKLDHGG